MVASLPNQIPLFTDLSEKRLIATQELEQGRWMDESDIFALYQANVKFVDITYEDLSLQSSLVAASFPLKPRLEEIVGPILEDIDIDSMKEFLNIFTAFTSRYYKSNSGKAASEWLADQVQDLDPKRSDIIFTVERFANPWAQYSVIARIHPRNSSSQERIILSAHLDSVNQYNPWFGKSPGADDNGSGSVTIFEALRVLLKSGWVSDRIVEFHWYSGEEAGLLGSQKIAAAYMKSKKQVYAVYHNDMTGYLSEDTKEPRIGVVTDNTSKALTPTLEMLIDTYSGIGWVHTKCGYGCSDHVSWTKIGVPAVFTFEGEFAKHSPFIHTTSDTVEHLTFEHMVSFVRTVVGFAVELGSTQ